MDTNADENKTRVTIACPPSVWASEELLELKPRFGNFVQYPDYDGGETHRGFLTQFAASHGLPCGYSVDVEIPHTEMDASPILRLVLDQLPQALEHFGPLLALVREIGLSFEYDPAVKVTPRQDGLSLEFIHHNDRLVLDDRWVTVGQSGELGEGDVHVPLDADLARIRERLSLKVAERS